MKESIMMQVRLTMLMICGVLMAVVQLARAGSDQSPEAVQEWYWNHAAPPANERVVHFHFYIHDFFDGPSPSVVYLVESDSPTGFGSVLVLDDRVTVGPDPDSKIIGRAQGLSVLASQTEPVLSAQVVFVFTEGKYNGSTLSVLGLNPTLHRYREIAIVGGTGAFRLARGTSITQTYSPVDSTGHGVFEFDLFVLLQ